MIDILLPLALAFIMFSLGLTLVPADFWRVLSRPQVMLIGLCGQMLMVPALAWWLAHAAGFSPDMALGLMILAACPGGVSSGLLTHLARGDTALSISLTAISSVLAVLSLPLLVGWSLAHWAVPLAVELPLGKMVRGIFLLSTLPVVLGMLLRRYRPAWVGRIEAPAARLATLFFILIVIATFIAQRETLLDHLATIGLPILALNLAIMAAAYGIVKALRMSRREAIAVAMECGLQNAALGIFVAVSLLRRPELAVPSVMYAFLMNLGALALCGLLRRNEVE